VWRNVPTRCGARFGSSPAFLVAQGALLLSALSLQRLGASIAGEDVGTAAAAVLLLNPFAFFGSAMLSESLFLFLSIECLRRAHRREFALAAVLGAAAALTRPIGAALVVPLLAASFERRSDRRETVGDACAFALVPAGAAIVPAWHGIALGAPFAYAEIQRQYGHGSFPDFRGVVELLGIFGPTPLDTARNVIQVAGLALAVAALRALRRRAVDGRIPWFFVVWGATALAVPLLSGHVISLPRYVFGAFPVFLGAAFLLPASRGGASPSACSGWPCRRRLSWCSPRRGRSSSEAGRNRSACYDARAPVMLQQLLPFLTAFAVVASVFLVTRTKALAKRLAEAEAAVETMQRRLADDQSRLGGRTVAHVVDGLDAQGRGLSAVQGDLGRLEVVVGDVERRLADTERRAREASETAIRAEEVVTGLPAGSAPTEEIVRRHLAGIGVADLTIDLREERPDGATSFVVRGLRGRALWHGRVIVRGRSVVEAAPIPARQFP
jgi:hypothetical protein